MRKAMAWSKDFVLAATLFLASGAGWAQASGTLQSASIAAMDCLLPAPAERGVPRYPTHAWANELEATLNVKLTFSNPEVPPTIQFVGPEHNPEFEDAVEQYVKRYRLPCLKPEQAPVVASQLFEFKFNDADVVDNTGFDQNRSKVFAACVRTVQPTYPHAAARAGDGGNVALRLTFIQRESPPDVDVIYGGRNRSLEEAAVSAAKQYQYTCELPNDKPLVATQLFLFRMEGGADFNLRNLSLVQFLGSTDRSEMGKVRFDFNTMGCPFDLKVALYRPYARNKVAEFEKSDPSRQEFIAWLSRLTVALPKRVEPFLIGKSLKVEVPCMILDLT